jgi:hypothetical protein
MTGILMLSFRRGILLAAAAEILIVASLTIAVYRNSQRAIVPPLSEPSAAATPPAAASPGAALSLAPTLPRNGSSSLPSTDATGAAAGLHVTLMLPAGAPSLDLYPAAILNPDGRTVWSGAATRVNATAVLDVRESLPPTDYQIQLGSPTSSLTIATYAFRVASR